MGSKLKGLTSACFRGCMGILCKKSSSPSKTYSSPSTEEAPETAARMLPSSLPAADNHTTLPPPPPVLPRVPRNEADEVEKRERERERG